MDGLDKIVKLRGGLNVMQSKGIMMRKLAVSVQCNLTNNLTHA